MSFEPEAVFLTHYSRVMDTPRLAADMHACLDAYVSIAHSCAGRGAERIACMKTLMHAWLVQRVRAHGCTLDQTSVDLWLGMDVDLNAQGLASDRKSTRLNSSH